MPKNQNQKPSTPSAGALPRPELGTKAARDNKGVPGKLRGASPQAREAEAKKTQQAVKEIQKIYDEFLVEVRRINHERDRKIRTIIKRIEERKMQEILNTINK